MLMLNLDAIDGHSSDFIRKKIITHNLGNEESNIHYFFILPIHSSTKCLTARILEQAKLAQKNNDFNALAKCQCQGFLIYARFFSTLLRPYTLQSGRVPQKQFFGCVNLSSSTLQILHMELLFGYINFI